ncbi:gamma-type small acid-soluble spore protein [Mesobacillus foraminis]|uniref:Gamma-type small acid-soluble spore protein n=1 Tax=Mesobacillus foraminis TaxID=279826 RepID=A0A4R2BAL8_9BACI|nr:gamma-type small acid-soluble spore protein [Mesobacillus foraminis]TCN22589.1 hypothetical protein EV146_11073 [Mesobacillus foraminis]
MNKYTTGGTDIESVKQQNANSGMSYNEVKAFLARTTGGHGTAGYSNTDVEQVKRNNSPDRQGSD